MIAKNCFKKIAQIQILAIGIFVYSPVMNPGLSNELLTAGITKIEQLIPENALNIFKFQTNPSLVYAELPLIKNRANSMVNQNSFFPNMAHVHTRTINKWTNCNLILTADIDPIYDTQFLAGILFNLSKRDDSIDYEKFYWFWSLWNDFLNDPSDQKLYEIKHHLLQKLKIKLKIKDQPKNLTIE